MKTTILSAKNDHIGPYFDSLPEGFKLANIDDFHYLGKKKLGLVYLVQWNDQVRFSIREVNESLTAEKINPFIKANKVFVQQDP